MADSPLLFLYGTDEFAISRRLNEIQSLHDKDGLNTARLEARTVSQDELHNAVNSMPFLSGKRLVFLANPSTRSSAPVARTRFLDFLLAAPPTTLVVLYEQVESRDFSRHWLIKRAGKGEFKAEAFLLPRFADMPGWILHEARRQGEQMDSDAAAALAEMVGQDTRLAAQEITKLQTFVNGAHPIRLADVEAVSIASVQGDIFALVDSLSTGDGKKAQRTLHRLLENEDAMALWGMVIRQFRLLLQAKEILEAGGNRLDVQEKLGLHEFVAGKLTDQTRRVTLASIEATYHKLLEMDEQAKTSQVPLDLALDILVVELNHPG
jgi:DNA polymerase-3 subunit delta